jgi:L-ascorbate metabolism protein UlaG (beta-lactamase superfamily)
MRKLSVLLAVGATLAAFAAAPAAAKGVVKVTPLGSHDGEFCALDRAMIFEDPNGTRILYDAGRTVRGADDPRLGKIDVVLLSHAHGDHLGDIRSDKANDGSCGKPNFPVKATPNSNTVDIAVGKKSVIVIGAEFGSFFAHKVKVAGGDPKTQVKLVRFGADAVVGGVHFTTVPAVHSNGISPAFLDGELSKGMAENGLTAYAGPPTGYVVHFTNGLVAYLSGDTGITAEQDLVVRRYYKANMAVMNIGDVYTTGPTEAAYVINEMVKPRSVIASHANEGATQGGKVLPKTRTATFIKATKVKVHVPLSGKTMSFDGRGVCTAGC